MLKILIAEDEKDLSRVLSMALSHEGYDVTVANDGKEAVDYASHNVYHCMVFDIMMPVMDGIEALTRIRGMGLVTPVILLTAKSEVEDRISGLDAGADDYLTKPFAMGELAARIRSVTRRRESLIPKVLKMGNFSLNTEQQELKAVNSIRLSKKESELLEYFILNRDKALVPDEIFSRIWADDPETDHDVVWVYVSYLRSKLDAVSANVLIEGEKTGPYRLKENT